MLVTNLRIITRRVIQVASDKTTLESKPQTRRRRLAVYYSGPARGMGASNRSADEPACLAACLTGKTLGMPTE